MEWVGQKYLDAGDPSYFSMTDACPTHEMRFLDNSDLCDENLVDDLLREIEDVDDIDDIDQTEEITVDRISIQNDPHGESEAERMKRQLSLMGKNERNTLTISVRSSVENDWEPLFNILFYVRFVLISCVGLSVGSVLTGSSLFTSLKSMYF